MYLSVHIFIIFLNLRLAPIIPWEREEKRRSALLCPLGSQLTVRQNSVLDARDNEGELRAVSSRQGLGKAPQTHPPRKTPPCTLIIQDLHCLVHSHTPAVHQKIISRSWSIFYAVHPLFLHQLVRFQTHTSPSFLFFSFPPHRAFFLFLIYFFTKARNTYLIRPFVN